MFFSVFNYYKKRNKKRTLKKSETKNIVKKYRKNKSSKFFMSPRRELKKVVL